MRIRVRFINGGPHLPDPPETMDITDWHYMPTKGDVLQYKNRRYRIDATLFEAGHGFSNDVPVATITAWEIT
jgi:hypothetical protein